MTAMEVNTWRISGRHTETFVQGAAGSGLLGCGTGWHPVSDACPGAVKGRDTDAQLHDPKSHRRSRFGVALVLIASSGSGAVAEIPDEGNAARA